MSKITKTNIKSIILSLAKEYKVKVFFSKSVKEKGLARYWRRSMTISTNYPPVSQLSTFFHELGHIYCYQHGLWPKYHLLKAPEYMTLKEKRSCYATALKAERWIDNWAKKEMTKHFPNVKFVFTYDCIKTVIQFKLDIKKELCLN
jgi:hypothetical protein